MTEKPVSDAAIYIEVAPPFQSSSGADIFLGRIETGDAAAVLLLAPENRLLIQVIDLNGTLTYELKSRPLDWIETSWFKVAVAWDCNGIRAFAGGQTLSSAGENGDAPIKLAGRAACDGASHFELEEARTLRKQLLNRTVRSRRRPLSLQELKDALREELDQLDDICELILSGKQYHRRGLAARLRLLIAAPTKTSVPLLQLVSAHQDRHLPVRASSALESLSEAILIGPPLASPALLNEDGTTDLDLWLASAAARVDGISYSQNQVLRAVADTLGAHQDPDVEPLIDQLRKQLSGSPIGAVSIMDLWLLSLANTCAALGRDLLKEI